MALKGLKKDEQDKKTNPDEAALQALMGGAQMKTAETPEEPKVSKAVFKRCTYSLTQEIDDSFDDFALEAAKEGVKCKKAEAVKAAHLAFSSLTQEQRVAFIKQIKGIA